MRRILLLVVLALVASACTRDTGPTTTVGSTSTTQSPTTTRPTPSTTQPENSLPVTIFIDGWSYRTLQGVDLYLQSENSLTPLPLDFQPLTPPEITELRTAQPDWVARIFARMVGADFNWACDASGCSSAAREVSAQDVTLYMLNPADIPGFGEVYGAWDVSSGIYAARSWLPIETEAFDVLGVPAGEDFEFAFVEWSSREDMIVTGGLTPTKVGDAYAALVGAGLGRIFELDPAWIDTGAAFNPDLFGGLGLEEGVDVTAVGVQQRILGAASLGLGAPAGSEDLRHLTSNELTYLTSPTIGCAPWVLCIPDQLSSDEVSISDDSHELLTACLSGDLLGFEPEEGEEVATPAVFSTYTRTLTLPAPAHLNGVWGGLSPEEFPTPTDRETQLLSVPPFASGKLTLETSLLGLYSVSFLSGSEVMWIQLGRVVEVGAESPETWSAADLLAPISGAEFCG